jgi:hypothetical protein
MRELHDCTFLLSLLHPYTTVHPLSTSRLDGNGARRDDRMSAAWGATLERSIFPIAPPLPSCPSPPLLYSPRIPPRYT